VTALLTANTIAAVASVGFAVLGGARPAALSDSSSPSAGERFYGRLYAARGVPLGVAAAVAPLAWPGPAGSLILFAAAAAQAGDAAIGIATRKWTMIAGGSVLAAIHAATAVATL
jgi:hypothetical protein